MVQMAVGCLHLPTHSSALIMSLIALLIATLAQAEAKPSTIAQSSDRLSIPGLQDIQHVLTCSAYAVSAKYRRIIRGEIGPWDMVQLIAACTALQLFMLWRRKRATRQEDANSRQPSLANATRSSHESLNRPTSLKWAARAGMRQAEPPEKRREE